MILFISAFLSGAAVACSLINVISRQRYNNGYEDGYEKGYARAEKNFVDVEKCL